MREGKWIGDDVVPRDPNDDIECFWVVSEDLSSIRNEFLET
jgi:hypothetical protein